MEVKIARTIIIGSKLERDLTDDWGIVVFVKSEDELWKQLLSWKTDFALESFTFQEYLSKFTLIICPDMASKKRFRRLKRDISLEKFNYPVKLTRGFPQKEIFEIVREKDLKSDFLKTLWERARKLTSGNETVFEVLRKCLNRCPFCRKNSLEVIDELVELKRKLKQLPEDQRPRFIFGIFSLILKCASCQEVLFRQFQAHFHRCLTERIFGE